jgi:hypothetical protein
MILVVKRRVLHTNELKYMQMYNIKMLCKFLIEMARELKAAGNMPILSVLIIFF